MKKKKKKNLEKKKEKEGLKKKHLNKANEQSNARTYRYIFYFKKWVYSRVDHKVFPRNLKLIEKKLQMTKMLETIENLGYAKIKGARNGSDARKLDGCEKWNFGGARKL